MPVPTDLPGSMVLAPPLPRLALGALPLQGVTVLAVEDSRFASDALRLMCQRSGARLRRAETLEQAQAHLRVYRPDVLLVDLGLPDGRGEGLIGQVVLARVERPAVLGMSGDPEGRSVALAAGADGFLDKPIASLGDFQRVVLALLPDRTGDEAIGQGEVRADRAALHDDLVQVAQAMEAGPGLEERRYLAGFLTGLARQTQDSALEREAEALRRGGAGLQGLTRLLQDRLAGSAPLRPGAV